MTPEQIMANPHSREADAAIRALPTIAKGHDADLKLEWSDESASVVGEPESPIVRSEFRLWVSRMTREDGARRDHAIILEHRYCDWRRKWGWRTFER